MNIYTEKLGDSVQTHERQNIYECMINCLQKAAELGIKSIAFPVLEPSIVHISKSKIVSTMLFAVKQFLREYNRNKLEDIRICSNVQVNPSSIGYPDREPLQVLHKPDPERSIRDDD